MGVRNGVIILLVGAVTGALTTLNFLGAQSFLLEQLPPVASLYGLLLANLLLTGFFHYVHIRRRKFAYVSLLLIVGYAAALAGLQLGWTMPAAQAFVWFVLTNIGEGLLYWMVTELCMRHLDPARAQSYFAYITTALEVGALGIILFVKESPVLWNPAHMIWVSEGLFGVLLLLIAFQFVPARNVEVRCAESAADVSATQWQWFRPLQGVFIFMTLSLGAFWVSGDYLIKTVLKSELVSFSAITAAYANVIVMSSGLMIPISLLVGRVVQRKRLSPIRLLQIQTLLLLGLSLVCYAANVLPLFLLLEALRRITEQCCYLPANQMIFSSFVTPLKNRLRSVQNIFFYTVSLIPFAIVFTYIQRPDPLQERHFIMMLMGSALFVAWYAIHRFRQQLIHTLYQFVQSEHAAVSVLAVHALSYLKPLDYESRMGVLLAATPHAILKKTVILGLGYAESDSAVDRIITAFRSDKEEIQLAVVDALRVSHSYKAIQFMMNIVLVREKPKSVRVRMNAMQVIAGLYGRKAIPLLLDGLSDADPRIVANALETLGVFRDHSLIGYFTAHLASPVPRVRANALMGLGRFRTTRGLYRTAVAAVLRSNDPQMVASILYAVGQLRDRHFAKTVARLADSPLVSDPAVQRCLAWAQIRLRVRGGFALFGRVLCDASTDAIAENVMHFFAQLTPIERCDVIAHAAQDTQLHPQLLLRLDACLARSVFDFRTEREYLGILRPIMVS